MRGLRILRSRFFWNLFASYTAVLLVTACLVGALVERRLGRALRTDLEQVLEQECRLLVPFAERALAGEGGDPQPELRALGQESELRITLVRSDGTVIGDSHGDPARMDDHGSRPEILQARGQEYGVSQRHSHTVNLDMLYVARRVGGADGAGGFVRVALPVTAIEQKLAATRNSVVLGTAAGFLIALWLGFFLASRITRPVAEMKRVAEDLREGRYQSRARVSRRDEIGLLAQTLNGLGEEITGRIAALSREDAQLRAMLASMVEGVVAVDEEDRIVFVNRTARELLEVTDSRPQGRTLWDLAPIRELDELLRRTRTSAAPASREVELFRGGKERVFQAHASPYLGGGKGGFVLVLHDITELRRLERIRRDFVANVSHELKTPLAAIQGFVETLLTGALHDEANNVRFLQRIDANVKRLTNLVTDLLSLARIESGQMAIQRTTVDWRTVLDGVLRLRESALQAKGLRLDVQGRERPLAVRGDPEAMTQVLDNLLDNAIQYTPSGRITVRLSTRGESGVVSVQDTGIGIPAADLERIFERFYRVDKARSRAAGGTGLGLSIVKNLVLRMEGEVTVESTEGRGSVFSVALPLA